MKPSASSELPSGMKPISRDWKTRLSLRGSRRSNLDEVRDVFFFFFFVHFHCNSATSQSRLRRISHRHYVNFYPTRWRWQWMLPRSEPNLVTVGVGESQWESRDALKRFISYFLMDFKDVKNSYRNITFTELTLRFRTFLSPPPSKKVNI